MFDKLAYKKAQKAAEAGAKSLHFAACHLSWFFHGSNNQLYVRVTVNGKRSPGRSTFISVPNKADFDRNTLTIAGDPHNSSRLLDFNETVLRVFREREITGRSLDATLIHHIALGLRGHDEQIPSVIEGLAIYMEMKVKQLNNGLAWRTVSRYQTYVDRLTDFVTITYGKNARFDQLKPGLEHDLMNYLKVKQGYVHNYALKLFQFFRSVIEYALAYEWVDRNVVRHVRLLKDRKPPVTLTMADLNKLKAASFVEPNAELVRDIFLFSIYTGMSYADTAALNASHLVLINDVRCVLKNREKSGVQAFTPLFPDAAAILEKYANHPYCRIKNQLLPVLSNTKMNLWLKVIGNTTGISLSLHTHLARKTFTMYAEELGFDLNEMAVMMGHSHTSMSEQFYYQRRQEPVIKRFKSIFVNENPQQRQAS